MDRKIAFLESKLNNLIANNNISIPSDQYNNQELIDKLDNLEKKVNDIPDYSSKLDNLEKKINDISDYNSKLDNLEKKVNDIPDYSSKLDNLEKKVNDIPDYNGKLDNLEKEMNDDVQNCLTKLSDLENKFNIILAKIAEYK